jgi:alpha-tubulin suppressor-like RCC1 family protein
VPTRLPSALSWAQVSPGTSHNCAITVLQDAYCWGSNQASGAGQLGDGTTTNKSKPTAVAGGFKFSRLSSGEGHTCGLRTDGAVFCWGQNQSGQIGDATTQPRTSPTAVAGGLLFETVGAGSGLTCALTPQPAGRPYCWGNVAGAGSASPVTYPSAPSFTALTVGGGHACGLAADGAAYCWGGNQFGQLGDSSQTSRTSPTKVAGDLRFTQISAGTVHTCGMTTAGAVACWGSNAAGELGDSTLTSRNRPRHIVLGVTP